MSLMRGVWVDPTMRTVRAQGGCLLGDVDRETQVYGRAAVLGFVSNPGIAGLRLVLPALGRENVIGDDGLSGLNGST
jgi:hypothetical protein